MDECFRQRGSVADRGTWVNQEKRVRSTTQRQPHQQGYECSPAEQEEYTREGKRPSGCHSKSVGERAGALTQPLTTSGTTNNGHP